MDPQETEPTSTHGTCPKCEGHGCYTTWASGSGYCHQCGHKPRQNTQYQEALREMPDMTAKKVPYRGIGQKAVDFYGVDTQFDDKTGKELRRDYHYPHATKLRVLPKDFSQNRGFKGSHLFGMDKFNPASSPMLTVVEGEDDALAAYEMLQHRFPVVALPSATISKDFKRTCAEYINSFDKIYLATDGDEAGDRAAHTLAELFPGKVYRVQLTTRKDAQAYLEHGEQAEFRNSWKNAKKVVPEFDTSTPEDFVKLLTEAKDESYLPTGIEGFDEEMLGIFQGHLTLLTAPEGTGKTEVFHYLEHRLLSHHPDVPFAACHLEESKLRTTLAWASYHLEKNVTRRDLIDDMEEVSETIRKLTASENAHLFKVGMDEDPSVLLERIKYYAKVYDCQYFFIEPIQDLAQQYTGSESTERFLSKIAVNLARAADELNVGIVMIGHENDEGQVSDCRKLAKQASVRIRLIRDLESDDPVERNTTTLVAGKNRPTSYTGPCGRLHFDSETFMLKEAD